MVHGRKRDDLGALVNRVGIGLIALANEPCMASTQTFCPSQRWSLLSPTFLLLCGCVSLLIRKGVRVLSTTVFTRSLHCLMAQGVLGGRLGNYLVERGW